LLVTRIAARNVFAAALGSGGMSVPHRQEVALFLRDLYVARRERMICPSPPPR
jgi:hypothetical protein